MKAPIKLALKAGFIAAAIALVVQQVDLGAMGARLASAHPLWLGGALVLFNGSQALSAARLARLLREYRVRLPFRDHLALYYVGMAANLFLPGGVGGDAYKVFWFRRRHGGRTGIYVAGLLLDRATGLAALLCLAAGAAAWWRDQPLWLLAVLPLLAVYALGVRLFFRRFAAAGGAVLGLGMAIQGLQGGAALALMQGLDLSGTAPPSLFLLLFFLSAIASLVPVTVGGLGARELVFLYGMQWAGHAPEPGVLLALSFLAMTVISALPGLPLSPLYSGSPARKA